MSIFDITNKLPVKLPEAQNTTFTMAAKLNLNLNTRNGDKPVTIFHIIHYRGNRFKISTGQSIEPKHWDLDADKQQVKRTRPNYNNFNSILSKQQNDIEKIILNLELLNRPVTKQNVVLQLDWVNSLEVKEFRPIGLFEKFIEVHKTERAERTIKGYTTTVNFLKKYEAIQAAPLSFNDFNDDFYKQFRAFLGMFDNAFGFYIKNIKTFLNWANDKGYNDALQYRKWKIPNEDGKDHFFLKIAEIIMLSNFEFEPRLQKVCDLFLIGCYCGLRYSDLATLKPIHVKDGVIVKIAKKTNEFVKIPVIEPLQNLLNKYWSKGENLPTISNQKGNDYLKELAKTAEIKRCFNYVQKKNKQSVETTFEAWQMMSWHVARHSFITNCIQLGVPQEVVRKVVGHSSFQTLKKYIQNDDDFNKKEMMKISKNFKK